MDKTINVKNICLIIWKLHETSHARDRPNEQTQHWNLQLNSILSM